AVLRIDPDDRDAKANLELVLQLLSPPPGPDEQPPGPDEPGNEQPGDEEPGEPGEEGEAGAGESGDPGEQPGGGETGEPSEGGGSGPPGEGEGEGITSLEEARDALAEALGSLGPEVSVEEALRI